MDMACGFARITGSRRKVAGLRPTSSSHGSASRSSSMAATGTDALSTVDYLRPTASTGTRKSHATCCATMRPPRLCGSQVGTSYAYGNTMIQAWQRARSELQYAIARLRSVANASSRPGGRPRSVRHAASRTTPKARVRQADEDGLGRRRPRGDGRWVSLRSARHRQRGAPRRHVNGYSGAPERPTQPPRPKWTERRREQSLPPYEVRYIGVWQVVPQPVMRDITTHASGSCPSVPSLNEEVPRRAPPVVLVPSSVDVDYWPSTDVDVIAQLGDIDARVTRWAESVSRLAERIKHGDAHDVLRDVQKRQIARLASLVV